MPCAMDRRFRRDAPFGMPPMAEPAPRSGPNLAYVQLAVWAVALGLIAVRWTIKGPPYLEALLMIPFYLTATPLAGLLTGHGLTMWCRETFDFVSADTEGRPVQTFCLAAVYLVASIASAVMLFVVHAPLRFG